MIIAFTGCNAAIAGELLREQWQGRLHDVQQEQQTRPADLGARKSADDREDGNGEGEQPHQAVADTHVRREIARSAQLG